MNNQDGRSDASKISQSGPSPDDLTPRGVTPGDDFRAGAGGATDTSPGEDGGTLGTGGSRREQDQ